MLNDPNDTLRKLRELTGMLMPGGHIMEENVADGVRLFEELDAHLTAGGDLPAAWEGPTLGEARAARARTDLPIVREPLPQRPVNPVTDTGDVGSSPTPQNLRERLGRKLLGGRA